MSLKKQAIFLLTSVWTLAAAGCGQQDAGPSEGTGVVFEDPYSDTGALVVTRDDQGRLSMAVRGRIGVDDSEVVRSAFGKSSLAEAYLTLHPQTSLVPDNIRTLSDELKAQRTVAIASLSPEQRQRSAPAEVPKDSNAFYANACQSSSTGFAGWTAKYCAYQINWNSICTYGTIGTSDRSFAWNESPSWGSHTLLGMSSVQRVPPWTFYWAEWGGVYDGRWSCLTLDGGAGGNLGITWHNYWTDLVLHGVDG